LDDPLCHVDALIILAIINGYIVRHHSICEEWFSSLNHSR
jgi:hypothetical protein